MTDTTTPITAVVDNYIAMWNEADPARRRELAGDVFTEDAGYVDPVMSGEGQDGIEAMVAAAQQQFPGHRFELTHGPDAHNDRVRFAWRLVGEGGPVANGVDFALVAPDGRLSAVTGFLEPAAS
jgi:SnoaL-like domain